MRVGGTVPLGATVRPEDVSTLTDYLRVLRRRKWLIIVAALLVPLAAVFLSLKQQPLYESSSEVLLNQQNLAASLTGIEDPTTFQDPARFMQTQVDLARLPVVAGRVSRATGIPVERLDKANAFAREGSNILVFEVTSSDRRRGARVATEFARQFKAYKSELDTSALKRARDAVQERIDRLEAAGETRSKLLSDLSQREQQLSTLEALQTSNALLVKSASGGIQVRPRPVRNGVLGFGLGLAFGIALAFLSEALDTRVRSAPDVSRRLGLPLLARVPEPPRRKRGKSRLIMLDDPSGSRAEVFRMLRTNLEFANLERDAGTIMITSSVGEEGKSTTIANLAVALARAGRRVVLVDLDLRRPALDRFFNLEERPGLTDVALGHVELESAIARIALSQNDDASPRSGQNGRARLHGLLEVLPAGPLPPDPGEFVGTRALADIFERLRERADFVLVDAPPVLHVGDAMTLSSRVDAILVVTRLSVVRRGMLDELHRLLETVPAAKLGFVLTGADVEDESYAGYYHYPARGEREPERVP